MNGSLEQIQALSGIVNTDWEEISQDGDYIYMGDFGNNANGNRTDLKIFKISKSSILAGTPDIETIYFSYSNQVNFEPTGANNTDFDCEALIVSSDSIFVFTKQWISNKTSVYSLPKIPGTYTANLKKTYDIQGLITGSVYLEEKNLVVLCGYSNLIQPFVYLLYDFSGYNFFNANKRKISISLPFHQVEGITTNEGLKYYISNESLNEPPILVPQKLHLLDFTDFLENYFNSITTSGWIETSIDVEIFPVPSSRNITIKTGKGLQPTHYSIANMAGVTLLRGGIEKDSMSIDISTLNKGMYLLIVGDKILKSFKVIRD